MGRTLRINSVQKSATEKTLTRKVLSSLSVCLCIIAVMSLFLLQGLKAEEANQGRVKVGIVERLGKKIPMDLVFKDSQGRNISLRQVADGKPLIVDMAYFECPGICDVVIGGIKTIVDNMSSKVLGRDFNIATVSFNPADKPADAMKKKEQFWGSMSISSHASSWRFLTGDSTNIHALTNALGFYFMRDRRGMFIHPTALIVVDKNGKIIRYIQGTNFALADVKMALDEAVAGTPEQIISSSPKMCFSHDPAGYKLTDSILRYGGVGTMVFVVGFLFFLRAKKKPRKGNGVPS